MRRLPAIIATLVLTVAAIFFTVSNLAPVRVEFGPWAVSLPLFAVMLVSLLAGFAIGVLVAWLGGRARRRLARDMAYRNAALTRQIDDLRRAQSMSSGATGAGPAGHKQLIVSR
jgi:uncharacterized integral membrane protein